MKDSKHLLTLFHRAGELKRTRRAGWVRCGVPNAESVADHTFRTAFIAMILGDTMGLDTDKLIQMALIHDLAELATGDITPHDRPSPWEKQAMENAAFNLILKDLPGRDKYLCLWEEYLDQGSIEAKILAGIDKLEMAIQACEYSKIHPHLNLTEFISVAEKVIENPEIKVLLDELKK
jgi:5'-deoxynucleotidase YfbR-like HD superfamily hydrolase